MVSFLLLNKGHLFGKQFGLTTTRLDVYSAFLALAIAFSFEIIWNS